MKVTCMMIIAVLLLTASIFITADDSRNGFTWKARHKMERSKDLRECIAGGSGCNRNGACCSGVCFLGICW
uniref:Conotoxin n=1 Tax=Conus praecellens TaxID=128530 RepID=A0A291C2M5_CONPC|nr:conotoxin [Conus praecellens]